MGTSPVPGPVGGLPGPVSAMEISGNAMNERMIRTEYIFFFI
jgi:hypothetical protein